MLLSARTLFGNGPVPFALVVCFLVALPLSASSTASDAQHDARISEKCMKEGSESDARCRKPMPPCPLQTNGAQGGPLVMLPNGVCGMLVDSGSK